MKNKAKKRNQSGRMEVKEKNAKKQSHREFCKGMDERRADKVQRIEMNGTEKQKK